MKPHVLRNGSRELSTMLPEIEAAIAANQAQQAELLSRVVRLQQEAGVPMIACQTAIAAVATAVASSIQAGAQVVDAHRQLNELRISLRVPETASGSPDGCPKPNYFFTQGHLPDLQVA